MAIEHQPPSGFKLPYHERLIFLAGPILGAPDWQAEAIDLLNTNFHVANPRHDYTNDRFDKKKQVSWEKDQLKRAVVNGGILFWFAARDYDLEYPAERPYAQTTRLELMRILGWQDLTPHHLNIAVGFDPEYEGHNDFYIRDTIAEHKIPIRESLAAVCHDVLRGMKS